MSLAKKIHLRSGEAIVEVVRRYQLTLVWQYLIGGAIIFLVSFFLFWLLSKGWPGRILLGVGIFLGIFVIFRAWFFWRRNIFVITTDRLVDISRATWFEEIISTVGFMDLKDIFAVKKGLLPGIFNYGSLVVEAKGENVVLEIPRVRNPERILADIIQKLEDYRQKRKVGSREAIYNGFLDLIPELSEEDLRAVRALIDVELNPPTAEILEISEEETGGQIVM